MAKDIFPRSLVLRIEDNTDLSDDIFRGHKLRFVYRLSLTKNLDIFFQKYVYEEFKRYKNEKYGKTLSISLRSSSTDQLSPRIHEILYISETISVCLL